MTMPPPPTAVTPETVRALAQLAALPLPPERAESLAPQLAAWLTAANELSWKMSAAEHSAVLPATVFTQPVAATQPTQEAGER